MTLLRRSLLMILVPTVILFLLMMYVTSGRLRYYASCQMEETLLASSESALEYVMRVVQKPRLLLEALTDVFLNGSFASEKDNLNVFTNLTKSYAGSTGFYGVLDGSYYDGAGWVPPADWDPCSRPWDRGAVADPEHFVYSDVYIDDQTGGAVVSISKVVFDEKHRQLGVVSADFPLETIRAALKKNCRYEDERMFILTDTGFFAVHDRYTASDSIREVAGGAYRDVADQFLAGKREIFSVKTDGVPYYYLSMPIPGTHWLFIHGRSREAVYTFVEKTSQIIVLAFLLLFAAVTSVLDIILHGIIGSDGRAEQGAAGQEGQKQLRSGQGWTELGGTGQGLAKQVSAKQASAKQSSAGPAACAGVSAPGDQTRRIPSAPLDEETWTVVHGGVRRERRVDVTTRR